MFTGVVKDTGNITKLQRTGDQLRLGIQVNDITTLNNYQIGDSCAVDGICLTATFIKNDYFELDVMPATFKKTTMINWKIGNQVNLERALSKARLLNSPFKHN